MHEGKRLALFGISDRFANENILETSNADDVAFARALDLKLIKSFVAENRRDIRTRLLAACRESKPRSGQRPHAR